MANLGTQLALSRAQPVELENKESLQRGLVALPPLPKMRFCTPDYDFSAISCFAPSINKPEISAITAASD